MTMMKASLGGAGAGGAAAGVAERGGSMPWLTDGYPGYMPVPTMLTRQEIDYLYWVGARWWSGLGRVCEMGPFLGGSTMSLCAGMAANARAGAGMGGAGTGARAAARGGRALLTYDAFVMDAESARVFATGVPAGESFRPVFESYLREHIGAGRVVVREGWLPTEVSEAVERALYPEQEPVEVLFIDAAKQWLVHNAVLRVFGRHLIPGRSLLIQQDFKHFGVYWLALHMSQLSACFEPVHDVAGASTVGFLYTGGDGGIVPRLGGLLGPEDLSGRAVERAWDEVEGKWAAWPETLEVLRLGRALHLLRAGGEEEGVRAIERAAEACAGGGSALLRKELRVCCAYVERKGVVRDGASLMRVRAAGERAGARGQESVAEAGERVLERCAAEGWRRVALFGAGRHTVELLRGGWPRGRVEVVAVVDEYSPSREVCGVRVVRPGELGEVGEVDAVIVSVSAEKEGEVVRAAERVLRGEVVMGFYAGR